MKEITAMNSDSNGPSLGYTSDIDLYTATGQIMCPDARDYLNPV